MAIVERPESDRNEPRGDGVPTVLRADYEAHLNEVAVRGRYQRVLEQRAAGSGLEFRELNPRPADSDE